MTDYKGLFNSPQLQAVEYCDGPALVIAGAGSGKTRVLTYKIAYLIERGLWPENIMALTFTNKAADEMRKRVAEIVGEEQVRRLWMGTFHSVFLRILRIEHALLGFSSHFTIYDSADSKSVVKAILKQLALDDKVYRPGAVLAAISGLKTQLINAEAYAANPAYRQNDARRGMPALWQIYQLYANRCQQSEAMDFDDILMYTYQLFERHPEVLDKWEQRFRYILVDEFQDTNHAQHKIVWQLAHKHRRICVVGDDAQSIYGFRGADIDNILGFSESYAGAKVFKLEQNYRSTQYIVEAANSLIAKNSRQLQKTAFSQNERGEQLLLIDAHSDIDEAKNVANRLREIKRTERCAYADFAVLYRTNAQSRVLEEEFRRGAIPYRVYGGLSFYQHKEVKDVIAYFRMAVNPHDEEAFKRIINYPARGIGQTTISKIMEAATTHNVSLWMAISHPAEYGLNVNKGTMGKLMAFKEMLDSFITDAQAQPASQVGISIVKRSGIPADIYQDTSPEGMTRQQNLEELMNSIQDFCERRKEEGNESVSLSDYLSEVSLMSDTDTNKDDADDKVTLMTIHSAKGLEFDTVFITGLEEGLFPCQKAENDRRQLEEERRLLYVAITRAKRHCCLSYSHSRYQYGQMAFTEASRFLADIDPKYLVRKNNMSFSRKGIDDEVTVPWARPVRETPSYGGRSSTPRAQFAPQPTYKRPDTSPNAAPAPGGQTLHDGTRILHNRYGKGTIERVEGVGDAQKITVRFDSFGTKLLLTKFAKFDVLSS